MHDILCGGFSWKKTQTHHLLLPLNVLRLFWQSLLQTVMRKGKYLKSWLTVEKVKERNARSWQQPMYCVFVSTTSLLYAPIWLKECSLEIWSNNNEKNDKFISHHWISWKSLLRLYNILYNFLPCCVTEAWLGHVHEQVWRGRLRNPGTFWPSKKKCQCSFKTKNAVQRNEKNWKEQKKLIIYHVTHTMHHEDHCKQVI